MKLKSWHISLIGLIWFFLYSSFMLSIGPAGKDLSSGGEFAGFFGVGFIFVFVVPGFFISSIIFATLKNHKNNQTAPILSLCLGLIGTIGPLIGIGLGAIDGHFLLSLGLLVPLLWFIAGIIGVSEARKGETLEN